MSNYEKSKIYKIVSNCNPELVYYGSTYTTLSRRLSCHKGHYKSYLKEKFKYVSSFELLKLEHFEIVLVEAYPCDNVEELRKRERYYIENNLCINKNIPSRTHREYRQDNREKLSEYNKIYYENNREKERERKKIYYENNREKEKERHKKYREDNREKERERSKKYRENNREKLSNKRKEIITCECGREMARDSLSKHLKTKIHTDKIINYLQLKNEY